MGAPPRPSTPVCDKLRALERERNGAQELWDWLAEQDYIICVRVEQDREHPYFPAHLTPTKAIAGALGIDLDKREEERRALLEYQRKLTEGGRDEGCRRTRV